MFFNSGGEGTDENGTDSTYNPTGLTVVGGNFIKNRTKSRILKALFHSGKRALLSMNLILA